MSGKFWWLFWSCFCFPCCFCDHKGLKSKFCQFRPTLNISRELAQKICLKRPFKSQDEINKKVPDIIEFKDVVERMSFFPYGDSIQAFDSPRKRQRLHYNTEFLEPTSPSPMPRNIWSMEVICQRELWLLNLFLLNKSDLKCKIIRKVFTTYSNTHSTLKH